MIYNWIDRKTLNHKIYDLILGNFHFCIQEFSDKSCAWWIYGNFAHHARSLDAAEYHVNKYIEDHTIKYYEE